MDTRTTTAKTYTQPTQYKFTDAQKREIAASSTIAFYKKHGSDFDFDFYSFVKHPEENEVHGFAYDTDETRWAIMITLDGSKIVTVSPRRDF